MRVSASLLLTWATIGRKPANSAGRWGRRFLHENTGVKIPILKISWGGYSSCFNTNFGKCMSIKYCNMCQRQVEPKRTVGVGTLLLAIISGGFALLLIPFYKKRCPICKGTALSDTPAPAHRSSFQETGRAPSPETHDKCPECKEFVLKGARVCKHCACKLVPVDA